MVLVSAYDSVSRATDPNGPTCLRADAVINYIQMPTNLLVVTPSPSFGEALRRALEESGDYGVVVVNNKSSAVVRADENNCRAAFLDLNLSPQWVEDIGRSLRTVSPEIKLLILTDNDTPPLLDSIRPWTLVRKPFESEDLYRALELPVSNSKSASPSGEADFVWLSDVTKAAQHLTRLSLETSSQAALITRNAALWAYAGQLSQSAANEIAKAVAHNWSGGQGSDLLRFIHLESTKAEHMLYATQLAEGVLLAMVFDAETPFSTIRSQAGQLVTSLSEDETREERPTWPRSKRPEEVPNSEIGDEDEGEDIEIPSISDIILDVPAPDPKRPPLEKARSADIQRPSRPPAAVEPDQTRRSIFSRESSPPIPLKELLVAEHSSEVDQTVPSRPRAEEELEVTLPSRSRPRPLTPVRQRGELDETRPHSMDEVAEHIVLEPVSAGVYNLTYACLLVPRFSSHYLTGDIADRLSEWLPNICVAFGWRLEYLAVRPEYLQWVVNVPPAASPGYLMRIVRQQTSEKVFTEFTRLKKENPSGDFWAPGYLIMGGTKPHPPQLVKEYILQIRQRQGLEKSRK
ncbi:MAG TPA: IS200/IS605 family transposase [Anaerolineales bacterium]|nr:IS200/IS605 family transposase [Anaerolineales bacterium]